MKTYTNCMLVKFSLLCLSLIGVSAQRVILTSKPQLGNIFNVMNLANMAKEHDLNHVASFDDVHVFNTDYASFKEYKDTLSAMFFVEKEQRYTITKMLDQNFVMMDNELSANSAPWHLDRISKRDLPLNGHYTFDTSGTCLKNDDLDVATYVIDTGIDVEHSEFEGRAQWLANFVDNEDTDCNSHGTHCAGLVGSKSYGACKDAKLYAVKVLNCEGSGSTTSVIRGIEYAFRHHLQRTAESSKKVKSIVSMSLGGGFSRALNMAVQATIRNANFYFVAAAGNEDDDACDTSPASVKEILTVMASDTFDTRAYFSNYGKCADLYSPGVNVMSTVPHGQTAAYSGTSMSTPVVAGVLNHYVDMYPNKNMKAMKAQLLGDSSKNKISNNPTSSNNYLVFLER
jgi:cerevisin